MLNVRAYTVMTELAVEVTCFHGAGAGGSHLLYRRLVPLPSGSPIDVMVATAEEVARCAHLVYTDQIDGLTDECALA